MRFATKTGLESKASASPADALRAAMEAMEARRLLSVSVIDDNGDGNADRVIVDASNGADTVALSYFGGFLNIDVNGVRAFQAYDPATPSDTSKMFVQSVAIYAGNGVDRVDVDVAAGSGMLRLVEVYGQNGDDVLAIRNADTDVTVIADGGRGDDTVSIL